MHAQITQHNAQPEMPMLPVVNMVDIYVIAQSVYSLDLFMDQLCIVIRHPSLTCLYTVIHFPLRREGFPASSRVNYKTHHL